MHLQLELYSVVGGISSRLRDRDLLKKRKAEAQGKTTYQWVHGEQSRKKRQRQEKKSSSRRYQRRNKTLEPEPSPEEPSQQEEAQEEVAPLAAPPREMFLAQEDPFQEQKSSQEPVEEESSHAELYSQNGSKTVEPFLIVDVGPEGENEQQAPSTQETLRIVPVFTDIGTMQNCSVIILSQWAEPQLVVLQCLKDSTGS
ncbi:UNVERIFIED_CONTAM: hypothetical protein FKN15_030033 [Acipenser sinensis]